MPNAKMQIYIMPRGTPESKILKDVSNEKTIKQIFKGQRKQQKDKGSQSIIFSYLKVDFGSCNLTEI